MGVREVFNEDDFLPHQKIVRINKSSIKYKTQVSPLLYNGIPINFQLFNWENNKWEVKKEYKNKTWNKELQIWE